MTTTYSDIDLSFTKKSNGDISDLTGIDSIKKSMENIVETMQMQRRMLPLFAGKYYNLLFEPMDEVTASTLGEDLLYGLSEWEPRINVRNVNIEIDDDNNKYTATITFTLRNSNVEEIVNIDIIKKG